MENTVLYIDDEIVNLMLFQEMFSEHYSVSLAKSTFEAEKIISETNFKVIVSDINMPKETGLQFFNRLPQTEDSPIFVILTAYVNDRLLLEALNQGRIFRYIAKPFDRHKVKETIDQAIKQYNLLTEKYHLRLQIEESQQNFYNIFQSSRDGIVILDLNESILEANKVVEQNLYTAVDILKGRKLSEFVPQEFHKNIKSKINQLFDLGSSRSELDYNHSTLGKRIYELSASSILYKGSNAVLIIIRDITERRLGEIRLMNAVIQAEENERSRIAKDIHDGIGPIMSTLKMYLEWLNKQDFINNHPDILELSLKSINEAIVTIKRIANNLSPHILEKFGLPAAVNKFVDNIKNVTIVQFNMFVDLKERIGHSIEISLYRIITECITNTIKHARATVVELVLRQEGQSVYFSYRDNGQGFLWPDVKNEDKGLGLHNINSRIKTLGGTILIQTAPGAGFKLDSEIPIK
jgi:PAS domain S-box-containing protein